MESYDESLVSRTNERFIPCVYIVRLQVQYTQKVRGVNQERNQFFFLFFFFSFFLFFLFNEKGNFPYCTSTLRLPVGSGVGFAEGVVSRDIVRLLASLDARLGRLKEVYTTNLDCTRWTLF